MGGLLFGTNFSGPEGWPLILALVIPRGRPTGGEGLLIWLDEFFPSGFFAIPEINLFCRVEKQLNSIFRYPR